jgi:hypothetical protein
VSDDFLSRMIEVATTERLGEEERQSEIERLRPLAVLQRMLELLDTPMDEVSPEIIYTVVQDIKDCLYWYGEDA